jgi:hypothetical protein
MLSLTGCGGGGGANVSDTAIGSFLSAQRGTKDALGPPINSFLRTQPGGSPSYAFPYDYFQRDLNGASTEQEARKTSARDASAWESCYGGTGEDEAYSIRKTADGGFLVAGFTSSNDYDISGLHEYAANGDGMLLKLNSSGAKEWVRCLGGTGNDCIYSAQETHGPSGSVNGYIVAGMTNSTDGDVTFANNQGRQCAWVAKLKLDRTVDWQDCFPGSSTACFYSIQQTKDGGYILGGTMDGSMYIVRLEHTGGQDASPNVTWSKTLGYSIQDCATSVQQTRDGGFIVAGITATSSMTNYHGLSDAWVGKYDASGSEQWEKCIGGSRADQAYAIQQTADGGYILTGHTRSNNGDVTGNPSISDCCWVVKLGSGTNPAIQWQSCQSGGGIYATGRAVRQTPDGGYVVAGSVDTLHSLSQIKAFKLDATGQNTQWSSILGGGGQDYGYALCGSSDGDTVVAGFTNSSSMTNYHDGGDAFIAKIGEPEPLSIENAQAVPAKFVPSSETTDITADIVAIAGFTPTNLSWGITIADSTQAQVASFAGTGARVSATWNGINAQTDQAYPPGAYTFTINATCSEGKKATANGTVEIVEKRIEIISSSVTPAQFTIDQEITISCTFKCYPENWPTNISAADVKAHLWDKALIGEYLSPIALVNVPPSSATATLIKTARSGKLYTRFETCLASRFNFPKDEFEVAKPDDYKIISTVAIEDERDTSAPQLISLRDQNQGGIRIENAKATPQKFYPSKYNAIDHCTHITGTIVPIDCQPTRLRWNMYITDPLSTPPTKDLLDSGYTNIIDVIWDGKKNDGSYYKGGDYNFLIEAECDQGSDRFTGPLSICYPKWDVPVFSVNDPRWFNEPYDHIPFLIGSKGCGITSLAMLLAYYNNDPTASIYNPKDLNNWLFQWGGYVLFGKEKGSIIWKQLNLYSNAMLSPIKIKFKGVANFDYGLMEDDLRKENIPLVYFDCNHIIVATGMYDPDHHTIADCAQHKYNKQYLEEFTHVKDALIRYIPISTGLPTPPISLEIDGSDDTGASVEYALIDPNGRHIGYDPSNGIRVKDKKVIEGDIPDAQYFCLPWSDTETDEIVGGAKTLWIYEPVAGVYTLKVYGIDASENYYLTISGDHPKNMDPAYISGFITPSQVHEYQFEFSLTPGVNPKVYIIGELDLEPKVLNLKSNGQSITAHIKLPTGHSVEDIDVSSIRLESQIPALPNPIAIGNQGKRLMVKFDRNILINYLKSKGMTAGDIILTVTGKVRNVPFRTTDLLSVKEN